MITKQINNNTYYNELSLSDSGLSSLIPLYNEGEIIIWCDDSTLNDWFLCIDVVINTLGVDTILSQYSDYVDSIHTYRKKICIHYNKNSFKNCYINFYKYSGSETNTIKILSIGQ